MYLHLLLQWLMVLCWCFLVKIRHIRCLLCTFWGALQNLLLPGGSHLELCTCFECSMYFFFPASYTAPIIFFLFSLAYSQRNQYLVAGCNNIAFCGQLTFPLEAPWHLVCISTAIILFAKALPAIILVLCPKWLLIHCVLCVLVCCP